MTEVSREEFEEVARQVQILYRSLDEDAVGRVTVIIKQLKEEEDEKYERFKIDQKAKMDEIQGILRVGIPFLITIGMLVYFLIH